MIRFVSWVALLMLVVAAAATPVQAATELTWAGGTGGIWTTSGDNWGLTGQYPWEIATGLNYIAKFNTASLNATVSGDVYANGVKFSTAGTLSGGTIHFDGATPTITYAPGSTLNSTLTGSGLTLICSPVAIDPAYKLTLGGSTANTFNGLTAKDGWLHLNKDNVNAFSGNLTIQASSGMVGVVILDKPGNIPSTAVVNMVSGIADLMLGGWDTEIAGLQSTGSIGSIGADNYAGSTANARLTINTINSTDAFSFGGDLRDRWSGSSVLSLRKTGPGKQTLTGASTYTGGTIIDQGILVAGSASACGSGTITINSAGSLNYGSAATLANAIAGSGTLNWTPAGGYSYLSGNMSSFTGTVNVNTGVAGTSNFAFLSGANKAGGASARWVLTGAWNPGQTGPYLVPSTSGTWALGELSGNGVLGGTYQTTTTWEIGARNSDSIFSGVIQNGYGGNGTVSISKVGSGTLALSGANVYAGATTVNAGALNIQNATALGTTAAGTTVVAGAALQIQGGISVGAEALTLNGTGVANDGALRNISGTNTYGGTVILGSAARINSDAGTLTLSNTVSGGFNLSVGGAGTLTLSGNNTYYGDTSVTGGTLRLSGTGAINSTTGIAINGAGAKFLQTSSTAVTPAITLTQGTLDGTGTVGAVTVGNGTGGIVANGNGNAGVLTVGSLGFGGAAAVNLNTAGSAGITVTNALSTTPANGQVTINVVSGPTWVNGSTYNLIGYGSFAGSASDFTKGTIAGLGARQNAEIGSTGSSISSGFITLTVTGDSIFWKGNGTNPTYWSTSASDLNWQTEGGTPTYYINAPAADVALFDNRASGTTVDITGGNVSPVSVTFANLADKPFTLESTGGYGIAGATGLTVNGGGAVTISSTNTYTGVTTVSNGSTLSVGADGNLGAIPGSATPGKIVIDGSVLSANTGFTLDSNRGIALGPTAGSGGGTIDVADGQTLAYGGIAANHADGTGSLTKTGAGTLSLGGANTYTGATNVTGGILQIGGGANRLPTGTAVTLSDTAGVALDLNNCNQTIASITGGGATGGNITLGSGTLTVGTGTFGGNVALGTGRLTVTSGTYSGEISGNGGLTKAGAAGATTLTLSGSAANTYTGDTIVNGSTTNSQAGYLVLQKVGVSAFRGNLTINTTSDSSFGAVLLSKDYPDNIPKETVITFTGTGGYPDLALQGGDLEVAGIQSTTVNAGIFNGWLSGSPAATPAKLTVNNTTDYTFAGGLKDNGGAAGVLNFTKKGSGKLTLSGGGGVHTLTGAFRVEEGMLELSGRASDATNGIFNSTVARTIDVYSGGTLRVTGGYAIQSGTGIVALHGGTLVDDVTEDAGGPSGCGIYLNNITMDTAPSVVRSSSQKSFRVAYFTNGNVTVQAAASGSSITADIYGIANGTGKDSLIFNVHRGAVNADLTVSSKILTSGYPGMKLVKNNDGILALTGANTYTGTTTVNEGTLLVNSPNGSLSTLSGSGSAVTVKSGATLGGSGTIGRLVSVESGAHLAPGASAGTLTVGSIDLAAGSILDWEFGALANDQVVVNTAGGLNLLGGSLNLYQEGTTNAWTTPGDYNLFQYTGTLGGSTDNLSVANRDSSLGYTFDTTGSGPYFVTLHIAQSLIGWKGGLGGEG